MSIRPPANYRVSRWLLLAFFALAMLASILVFATSCTDILIGVLGDG
ncbi:hypothetical protein [Saccharopolyspora sp. 5N708]